MQFNSEANNQDIVTMARLLAGADADALPLNELTLYANNTGARVWSWIFESYGGMKYDDSNQSGDPSSTDNLVNGTGEYSKPSAALAITGVEAKDQAGFWYQLKPITEEEIRERSAIGDFRTTDGNPEFYWWEGSDIKLFPAPNYDSANGLKFFFLRSDIEFAPTDTTAVAGFASVFHEVIPYGIAEQYCAVESKERWTRLAEKMQRFERDIREYYSKLHKAHGRPQLRAVGGPDLMREYG